MGQCVASKDMVLTNVTLMEYMYDQTGYYIQKSGTKNLISGIELAEIGYRVIIDTDDYTHGRFNLWGPNNVYIGTYYSTNDNQFLVNYLQD